MSSIEKEDLKGLVKKLISSVLVSNPSLSSTFSDLEKDYQQQIGEAIPYSKLGYSSLKEFLADIPDILKVEVIGGKKIVKPVVSSKVAHIHQLIRKQKKPANKKKKFNIIPNSPISGNSIPIIIESRLKSLIKSFKDGLLCSELPGVYKLRYKKELNYKMYKYKSLLDMCRALQSIFVCRRVSTGEVMLFAVDENVVRVPKKATTQNNNSFITSTPNQIATELDMYEKFDYPFNVLTFDESISCQFLPPYVKTNDFVKVCVTEIYDPSKFWITLHEYSSDFEQLHRNMQSWYSQCSTFKIDEKYVRYGIFCSAPYSGEFYRAMVVKLMLDNHLVKVFFIDYGTVSVVDSRNLLFLHRHFSYLPQQAIRARLGEIYPRIAQHPWPNEAREQLLSFVTEKVLIAQILKINHESEIIEVALKDGPYTECINNRLVQNKLANYTFQEQSLGRYTNTIPSVNFIHLYPTFNEIEQGIVPNHLETNHLLNMGFSYDYLYPHYYKKHVIDDYILNSSREVSINVFVDKQNPLRFARN